MTIAVPLNQVTGMPRMAAAFAGWTNSITLLRRTQIVVDGFVTYTTVPFSFKGTIQPLSPKQIQLKPEGQRAFEWLQVHTVSGPFVLDPNDQIVYNGKSYKIMAQNDYSRNGFIEYHLIADYQ